MNSCVGRCMYCSPSCGLGRFMSRHRTTKEHTDLIMQKRHILQRRSTSAAPRLRFNTPNPRQGSSIIRGPWLDSSDYLLGLNAEKGTSRFARPRITRPAKPGSTRRTCSGNATGYALPAGRPEHKLTGERTAGGPFHNLYGKMCRNSWGFLRHLPSQPHTKRNSSFF